jgi:chromatin remodeling complex protein RSC6
MPPKSSKTVQNEDSTANDSDNVVTLENSFETIFESLGVVVKTIKSLQDTVKTLQKQCKTIEKKKKNRVARVQEPLVLSKELCVFLKVPLTKRMSKAEVMKTLSTYIKESNLQIEENKRKFKPNKDLCKLFKIKPNEIKEMTFVEINKYIIQHVTKPIPVDDE